MTTQSPTKLAIALLTQQRADITSSLAALGLLTDDAALAGLEDVVQEFTAAAWEEYGNLTKEVEAIAASLQQVGSRLALARGEELGEEGRYNELKRKKAGSEAELAGLERQLDALETGYNSGKAKREEEIEGLKEEIWETKAEFAGIHQETEFSGI